ncbi:MAG: hypothetical protein OXG81_17110 [Acidobacteria bacterium]|nr:hypothetical protein [Acidobacteriota bacterium]
MEGDETGIGIDYEQVEVEVRGRRGETCDRRVQYAARRLGQD